MSESIEHPEGRVLIDRRADGSASLRVELDDPTTFVPTRELETAYSNELIALILAQKGPAWVCDEIRREEDPAYILATFESAMFGYVEPGSLAGKRMLDFGCGGGASTATLGRRYPELEIVGVELEPQLLEIARARVEFYGLSNVRLYESPGGTNLPAELGSFDMVLMSGVFEHLLPEERAQVMPLIWSQLAPGGVLFLNQTPNRLFPFEGHTTSLPLINYLPDSLALWTARRFSGRVGDDESWESLLRRGIRGGTVREIMRSVGRHSDAPPQLLAPSQNGVHDRIDLWLSISSGKRPSSSKRWMARAMKVIRAVSGAELVPELSLAIRKA